MSLDIHKLASLLVRDYTIMAKRHYDLSRDCRAIAQTWRLALDDTVPVVLKERSTKEDCMLGAPAVSPRQDSESYQKSFEAME